MTTEPKKESWPVDDFNTKWYWDFRKNAWYCMRCNNCKWIDSWQVKGADFARICPSNAYYHFDTYAELERALTESGKDDLLESIRNIVPPGVSCVYIRQGEPLGLGHAVLCARPAVGDEPFFIHLADDLIAGQPGCLAQMADEHARHGGSVVAVETVPRENTSSYGIVEVDASDRVTRIVEKPKPEDAPSNSAVVGRYLLTSEIFDKLEKTGRGAGGEIQLTDGIADLLDESPVYAYSFSGVRYDCGSKLGYLQATVAYGLEHEDTGDAFRSYLKSLVCD